VCEEPACGRAFGYKHLLQRHAAKVHTARDAVAPDSSPSDDDEDNAAAEADAEYTPLVPQSSAIDVLTGKMYASRRHSSRSLHCPYPRLDFPGWNVSAEVPAESSHCDYYFTRAYDLRRHLAAVHDVEVDKEPVDEWTARARARS
jgi:general transcription factor IIIA